VPTGKGPTRPPRPDVFGKSVNGNGVAGESTNRIGVLGESTNGNGVVGISQPSRSDLEGDIVYDENGGNTAGVAGISNGNGAGVYGETRNPNGPGAGVEGISNGTGAGVFGRGRLAGRFEGDVEVTGDVLLTNGDCAEDFDMNGTGDVEPGTVMVFTADGPVEPSYQAYDKRVAGVVSGAGDSKPAIVLGRNKTRFKRIPIALMGKVYCKVDASYSSIQVGDMLTTSNTKGHAMKIADPLIGFGAAIGKALRPLKTGRGLIPVLIALQ
jgi:hypothetical protein